MDVLVFARVGIFLKGLDICLRAFYFYPRMDLGICQPVLVHAASLGQDIYRQACDLCQHLVGQGIYLLAYGPCRHLVGLDIGQQAYGLGPHSVDLDICQLVYDPYPHSEGQDIYRQVFCFYLRKDLDTYQPVLGYLLPVSSF